MKMAISVDKKELQKFCKDNGIKKLALFGSVIREDFGPKSDVDVLVEFQQGRVPDLFQFVGIQDALSTIFSGRKVDLVTYKALREGNRKNDILRTAEVFYETAA